MWNYRTDNLIWYIGYWPYSDHIIIIYPAPSSNLHWHRRPYHHTIVRPIPMPTAIMWIIPTGGPSGIAEDGHEWLTWWRSAWYEWWYRPGYIVGIWWWRYINAYAVSIFSDRWRVYILDTVRMFYIKKLNKTMLFALYVLTYPDAIISTIAQPSNHYIVDRLDPLAWMDR